MIRWISRGGEFVAATMMAAMFVVFILQIFIRYTARLEWVAAAVPALDPDLYGWTLEFCLLMWLWIVFWGNSFVVRERDHVTFDILYIHVNPTVRRWFAVITGLAIAGALLWSLAPTWHKFHFLAIKHTATLEHVFGSWIRVRDVYLVYFLFLIVVPVRYAWRAWISFRHGAESDLHHYRETGDE